MVAVGAAQGAGATALSSFLPGLVVALSANRVATLYSEMMLLQRDRANARSAEERTRLDLAILVRRQLLKINILIQQGELSKAEFFLIKTERYLHKHRVHAQAKLFDLLNNLKAKLKSAERIKKINQIINQARYPYKKALTFYKQKRELKYAQQQAQKALNILQKGAKQYAEIKKTKALAHSKKLLAAIKTAMGKVESLKVASIQGSKRVGAGSTAYFTIKLKGGVPDYQLVNLEGYGDSDSVMIAWDAPEKAGKYTIKARIKDDLGKQISAKFKVAVVEANTPATVDRFQQYADPFYDIDFSNLEPVKLKNWKGFYPPPYDTYWGDKTYEDSCYQGVCWKPFSVVQYRDKDSGKPAGMVLGFEDKAYSQLRMVAYYVDESVAKFRDAKRPKSYPYDPPSMWYGDQGIQGFMTFDSQGRKTYQRYTYVRGNNFFREEKRYEEGKLMHEWVRRNDQDTLKEKDYTPEPKTESERLQREMFEGFFK